MKSTPASRKWIGVDWKLFLTFIYFEKVKILFTIISKYDCKNNFIRMVYILRLKKLVYFIVKLFYTWEMLKQFQVIMMVMSFVINTFTLNLHKYYT
jgi:hypothetical protein